MITVLYIKFSMLGSFQIVSFDRYQYGTRIVNLLRWHPSKNANEYQVIVYDENHHMIWKEDTDKTELELAQLGFQEEECFSIEVIAKSKNQTQKKTKEYSFVWEEAQKKVAPVKSNKEKKVVSGRKKVALSTETYGSTIYYTTDGSQPTVDSEKYEEPILLTKSMTIQAFAIKEGYEDSAITTFTYEVISTNPIVYLSPSTQDYNTGIKGTGYTTEQEMMNQVTDVIESTLKEKNITVYRNKPTMTNHLAIRDSKKYDVDLHLAIHSNASPNYKKGSYTGIETWVYSRKSTEALRIAKRLQQSLVSIYYSKYGDRGIHYSVESSGLAETAPYNVNNGILLEIAFHDNWNDAVWMVKNKEKIGQTIANTIIQYYEEQEKEF